MIIKALHKIQNFTRHALRHLANGDLVGWIERIRVQIRRSPTQDAMVISNCSEAPWHFGIITMSTTEVVAHLLSKSLQVYGWHTDILTSLPNRDEHDWYIVLSPQLFSILPPLEKCILFSIEESATEYMPNQKDLTRMRKSFAVLVSSFGYMEYLARKKVGFPLVHYLPTNTTGASVASGVERFSFMFDRFLIAKGFLSSSCVTNMKLPLPKTADRVGLSLPETIDRRKFFGKVVPPEYCLFDGIRRQPGWVGCGLSYQALAYHALKYGISRFSVMEDDVVLPPDFNSKIGVINSFLDVREGRWDVFAGVVADLHSQTKILSVEFYEGITFVTINKMTSTVFNIYSEKSLRLLASWNSEDLDAEFNTIDRYLERQDDLRVIVTLPFLVGHHEDVTSTLWGSSNKLYSDLIKSSEEVLARKVSAYQRANVQ